MMISLPNVLAIIGIMIWMFGIAVIWGATINPFKSDYNSVHCLYIFLITGLLGYLLVLDSLYEPIIDITHTYVQPASITKLNGTTLVNYIDKNNKFYTVLNDSAAWWISSNIVVQITQGKNLVGKNVQSCEIVIAR